MITQRFRSWRTKKREQVEAALMAAGAEMTAELKESISEPYPPASAPGEPPHLRTGQLAAGIGSRVTRQANGSQLTIFSMRVGRSIVPRALEFGTSRMAARPYMGPLFRRWKRKFLKFVANYLRQK